MKVTGKDGEVDSSGMTSSLVPSPARRTAHLTLGVLCPEGWGPAESETEGPQFLTVRPPPSAGGAGHMPGRGTSEGTYCGSVCSSHLPTFPK